MLNYVPEESMTEVQAVPWYDPKTGTWLTYTGEFNSYAEAIKNIKGVK